MGAVDARDKAETAAGIPRRQRPQFLAQRFVVLEDVFKLLGMMGLILRLRKPFPAILARGW